MRYEPELGQAVFGNTPWQELNMDDMVEAGLSLLGSLVPSTGDPTTNSGAEYDNDTFTLRAYCWCDGNHPSHGDGCPPNFECGDFRAAWYKWIGRGSSQSREVSPGEWRDIMVRCLASLPMGAA